MDRSHLEMYLNSALNQLTFSAAGGRHTAQRGRGLSGAVGGILRQVPSTLVKPVILATAATTNVLEGVKNQVAPEDYQASWVTFEFAATFW